MAMAEVVNEKREELHEDLVISNELACKEREGMINASLKETVE